MISAIFDAVKDRLAATLKDLGQAVPGHSLGAKNIATTSAPPNIVWVVTGGPVTPARQVGADRNLGTRELAERNERVLVHVWADDFKATEILMNHFVAAARSVLTGYGFQAKGTDWMAGQEMSTARGVVCVLEIEIRIPFTAEPIAISGPPHTLNLTAQVTPPQ